MSVLFCQANTSSSPLGKALLHAARPSGHEIFPLSQRGLAAFFESLAVDKVAVLVEVAMNAGMNFGEFLR